VNGQRENKIKLNVDIYRVICDNVFTVKDSPETWRGRP